MTPGQGAWKPFFINVLLKRVLTHNYTATYSVDINYRGGGLHVVF